MVLSVFLSHCTTDADRSLIRELELRLTKRGLSVYLAERDIQAGLSLPQKVLAHIRDSDIVAVVWTKRGAESKWVNQEVGAAKSAGKLVVPIVEKGVQPGGLLEGIEWVEFDRDNPETALESLEDYLQRLKERKETAEAAKQQREEFWENVALVVGVVAIIVGVVLVIYAVAKKSA